MMPSVLITGAAGFVGGHVVRAFVEKGWQVHGYDMRMPARPMDDIKYYVRDIRDRDALHSAAERGGVAGIIHSAAIIGDPACLADPAKAVAVNVQGTCNVLEVAYALKLRVTFVSTATLYGRDPTLRPLPEDAPVSPVALYDASKSMAEILCFSYNQMFDLDITVVRTSFVYGPGHAIGRYFLTEALNGIPVYEPDGGDHPCDYTYIKDLVNGIYLAHTVRPIQHQLFNLSGGILRKRKELADLVRNSVPNSQIELGEGMSQTLNLRGPCVIERARSELGYSPQYTLEMGVKDWISEQHDR